MARPKTGIPDADDRKQSVQARLAAIVIAATGLLWLGAQWLGRHFGWDARYAFLFDLAAIAAFIWAMVVTYQIWRKRQTLGKD